MMTALMIATIVLSNSAGDIFITRGMKQIGDVSTLKPLELLLLGKRILSNRDFLLGVFFLAVSFFSFLAVLSWADMSFIVPATSIFYVVSILGAKFILKEEVNKLRWAGTVLVCLGVAFICFP